MSLFRMASAVSFRSGGVAVGAGSAMAKLTIRADTALRNPHYMFRLRVRGKRNLACIDLRVPEVKPAG